MPLPEPRYVVTELEGFDTQSGWRVPGISVMVIDRHICHRLIATFRSEDQSRRQGTEGMRTVTRRKANDLAARLNG